VEEGQHQTKNTQTHLHDYILIISISPQITIGKLSRLIPLCKILKRENYTSQLETSIWRVTLVNTLGADLRSILVAVELLISDATLLTVAFGGADRGQETHIVVLPHLDQGIDELIHHLLIVLRSWCNAQPFLAALHCGIVDGLYIYAMLGQHIIGDSCALCSIPNL